MAKVAYTQLKQWKLMTITPVFCLMLKGLLIGVNVTTSSVNTVNLK